jgi:hypothetical protein
MDDFVKITYTHRLMLMATAVLSLPACNMGGYNRSLTGQINALQQEVAQLREENRVLNLKLQEIQKLYGIKVDSILIEQKFQHSIFDKVFSIPLIK